MFLSKKNVANLYAKRFVSFSLKNRSDVAWHISETLKKLKGLKAQNLKGFERNDSSVSSP